MNRHQELRREVQDLTDAVIAARAAYKVWARPLIAADRDLTEAETAEHDRAGAEIDRLDGLLAAKARELVEAASEWLADQPQPDPPVSVAELATISLFAQGAKLNGRPTHEDDLRKVGPLLEQLLRGEPVTGEDLALVRLCLSQPLAAFLDQRQAEDELGTVTLHVA
jgi:hypothetical protein